MTAKYMLTHAGTYGRPRAVLTDQEIAERRRRHQDAHNARRKARRRAPHEWTPRPEVIRAVIDRDEIARRIAVVRAAKLEHLRRHGSIFMDHKALDALNLDGAA